MTVELNCHRNMMAKNSPLHFSLTCSQTHNGNGALESRKPIAFTVLYQSGTTIYWSDIVVCNDHNSLQKFPDPFCKCISKWLLKGKAHSHEVDTFTHIKGLLYKHIMDSNQNFLAPVIPKSWHFTIRVEVHDKLGHQGLHRTYPLTKWQYYWKGMNKDICKYNTNCALSNREKARTHVYPLQMTDIPDRLYNKIAIDLVSDLNVSASGNQHIMTINDHLTGWPEAFPIPNKKADTFVWFWSTITYISTCALASYCQTMGQNSRTS